VIPLRTTVLVASQRQDVNVAVERTVRSVVREYVRVSDDAQRTLSALLRREAALVQAGEKIAYDLLRQRERAERLLLTVQSELARLAEAGQVAVRSAVTGELVPLAVDYENALIRSQLPPELQTFGTRVSPEALNDIIVRSDTRMAYLRNVTTDVARTINRTLVDGIVAGQNPRAAARTLMAQVGRAFDGGLVRAERIMRTEMLDAYRNAQTVITAANADVLDGVSWQCQADDRTCTSCWAMQGEVFPVGTPGPDDHQNGRCVFVPVVRSDLRGDFPMGPTKDELWGRLTDDQKLRVLGPTRYDLTGGGPPPRDFSMQVPAGEWRSYRVATPVRDLVGA
jgi:SPP1 gp7 family putative phage head morphogenesis protein